MASCCPVHTNPGTPCATCCFEAAVEVTGNTDRKNTPMPSVSGKGLASLARVIQAAAEDHRCQPPVHPCFDPTVFARLICPALCAVVASDCSEHANQTPTGRHCTAPQMACPHSTGRSSALHNSNNLVARTPQPLTGCTCHLRINVTTVQTSHSTTATLCVCST